MTWYALGVIIGDKSDLEWLGFKPYGKTLSVAKFEWHNVVLNPASDSAPVVDLSDQNLSLLLNEIFNSLSLAEHSQLIASLKNFPRLWQAFDPELYFSKQNQVWNQRFANLLTFISSAPKEFLYWAHERQMSNRDLQPLLALKNWEKATEAVVLLATQNPSRNEGKQLIDLLVDLILLDTPLSELQPTNKQSWLDQLQQIRNPVSLNQPIGQAASTDNWPQYVQIVKHRQGDRILHKMQITYSDANDLSKKLNNLKYEQSPT